MNNFKLLLTGSLLLALSINVLAGGIPLTTNDLNLNTAINSNDALLDVLSNDDSGIPSDSFKEVIAVCASNSSDMDCSATTYTDGIGMVTVNGSGDANNVLFTANHDQSHTFEFKYLMRNSASSPGSGLASVELSYVEVNTLADGTNNGCDSTECSLREAFIFAVNDGEPSVISFKRDLTGTIALNSSLVVDSNDLSIVGTGAARINLSGSQSFRVLSVPSGTERFSMSGLTISNGQAPSQENGGGILIESALETRLENIRVIDNIADNSGGGIYALNAGLTIVNSEISNNTATNDGGGIAVNGGFGSDLLIENTTISQNQSSASSGGLYINSNSGQNTVLRFITTAFNSDSAIDSQVEGPGNIIIESSVFEPGLAITIDDNITNNSIFKNIAGNIFGNNNRTETETILNPMRVEINDSGLYGHKFDTTSLAYNHVDNMVGNPSCGNQVTSDQFGAPRPTDGVCDAGAYEYRFIDVIFISGFE